MRMMALAAVGAATMMAGCSTYGDPYGGPRGGRGFAGYDYNRPDPAYGGYYADRYYREGRRYRERRLSANEGSMPDAMAAIIAAATTGRPA